MRMPFEGPTLAAPATCSVLVVDADRNVVSAIARRLRVAGIPVITAVSGKEALALLNQHRIGVIVSDAPGLPLTGIELFRKARESCPGIKTILLSDKLTREQLRQAWREGDVHASLSEPWDNDCLLAHVHSALAKAGRADRGAQALAESNEGGR